MAFSLQIAQNFVFHVSSRWAIFLGHVIPATNNLTHHWKITMEIFVAIQNLICKYSKS
jgi:hypothetical protein